MTHRADQSLQSGIKILERLRIRAMLAIALPFLLPLAAFLAIRYFDPRFLHNPVLVALFALFTIGQIVLLVQLVSLIREAARTRDVLKALKSTGERIDPRKLSSNLEALPPSDCRDLVLAWLDMGLSHEVEVGLELLRNSIGRRGLVEHRRLGLHALVNRTVMKLGFLGTLVGLLLTFPPMKRAILGLSDSGGEMRFITDIAQAIDEDAYAIQATLVATALSLALEALSVQVMESFFRDFEQVDTHLADWNIGVLRPAIQGARAQHDANVTGIDQEAVAQRIVQAQKALDLQLAALVESIHGSHRLIEGLTKSQQALAVRIDEIAAWELDYRRFLATKREAALPPGAGRS
ncbi:MAG: hypothetical protein IPK50_16955 [Fibrobacterota bacterium]|nr:hypothetical protein [Fibrobacterota bacterium]QQS03970.1 MAG: hypothetical protein IPK50_16955 [Fibrobacterota bacterium]